MTGDNINESEHASSCPEPNTTPSPGIPQPSATQPSHSRPPLHPNSYAENDFIDLEPYDTGTQSRKPRQLKSIVWHHFRRVMVNGEQKADCLHCNQRLSTTSKNDTSHLKDHLEKRCPKKHIKVDIRQHFIPNTAPYPFILLLLSNSLQWLSQGNNKNRKRGSNAKFRCVRKLDLTSFFMAQVAQPNACALYAAS
ncbi:hypothetical protein Cgig2_032944 [Carnegiea gigantea]|uniref:BED-type domain-containing protein n=1 Tax=Carnegiea gigantea TaxID=171969 RepID=A0A9Q1GRR2_9CARY|nr:hypothetical protein Cgig2_032944 [Carnegiea gigantea]